MQGNYLKDVREQYEEYPYPYRNPQDEKKRLINTALDGLPYLNHVIYGGKQSFTNGYKVLVAGGGTGDSTIYLAEQLRDMPDAVVVYVDLSTKSMAIAKERAKARGLKNIQWHHMSLLDIAGLGEKFDYINCSGVLHHLADPVAGLKALKSALKADGALGIMVYAQYGRTSIYQMQELMKRINKDEENPAQKVAITKKVMPLLPASNLFRQQQQIWNVEFERNGDIGIYDLLLHSTDRAYTVPELYDWMQTAGLTIPRFSGGLGYRLCYMPEFVFGQDAELMQRVKKLPEEEQQAIAELAHANISRHIFFAAPHKEGMADVKDDNMVPFFFMQYLNGPSLSKQVRASNGPLAVQPGGGVRITLPQGKYVADILENMDEEQTIGEIIQSVVLKNKDASVSDVRTEFEKLYEQLEMIDALLLRHKDVPAFAPAMALQKRIA